MASSSKLLKVDFFSILPSTCLVITQTLNAGREKKGSLKIMALQLSETLKETITVYTGLSPPTLFILVALGLPIYYVVSDMFGSSSSHHQRSWDFEEEMQPLPPLSSLRDQRRGVEGL
ncbi:hypothetical protein RJ640_014124 [Escallonia rubra]|uniref:Uncharacterized protein n=1 Tax=Escallonia rubra TaxID=112253 RepID=A0AA88QJG3_9ASTE|nr:hypothetical protein RJ640_014124 [Escallonia rubra]